MAEYIERERLLKIAYKLSKGSFSTPLIISSIEKAPKADAVEVKHGYWKYCGEGDWHCTNCNEIFTLDVDMHPIDDCGMNFCPNCGEKIEIECDCDCDDCEDCE